MEKLLNYFSFVKIEHTLFSIPLIFTGAFIAEGGVPDWWVLLLIIAAGFGARTAALGLNRIIDRRMDAINPRTQTRELPTGKVKLGESMGIVAVGMAVYLAAAYLICPLVLYLSPIPLVVFVLYPYMKRFTELCHFGVGLGLALSPLGGYVAVTCSLDGLTEPVLLALFTLFWVAGFDIIYATLDEEFDRSAGIYSMVSRHGRKAAIRVSAMSHLIAFVFLAVLYVISFAGIASLIVLLGIGWLLFLEQRKSNNVDLAFFKINTIVGFAVLIFVLAGIYLP